jgi:hypothetical protein
VTWADHDMPSGVDVLACGDFIVACGGTDVMEVLTWWSRTNFSVSSRMKSGRPECDSGLEQHAAEPESFVKE